jgi:sulfite exporter TauE/SafE
MMKILIGILMVILGITLAACAIILLYLFWFKAVPEFWRIITKKQDHDK